MCRQLGARSGRTTDTLLRSAATCEVARERSGARSADSTFGRWPRRMTLATGLGGMSGAPRWRSSSNRPRPAALRTAWWRAPSVVFCAGSWRLIFRIAQARPWHSREFRSPCSDVTDVACGAWTWPVIVDNAVSTLNLTIAWCTDPFS